MAGVRPSRVEVEIGELVLHGVPRDAVPGVAADIETHLAALTGGAPGSREPGIGEQVARAVWDAVPGGSS